MFHNFGRGEGRSLPRPRHTARREDKTQTSISSGCRDGTNKTQRPDAAVLSTHVVAGTEKSSGRIRRRLREEEHPQCVDFTDFSAVNPVALVSFNEVANGREHGDTNRYSVPAEFAHQRLVHDFLALGPPGFLNRDPPNFLT